MVIQIFTNHVLEFPKITNFTVFRAHRRQTDRSAAVSRHKRFVQSKSSLLLSLSDTASRTFMSRMSSSCLSSLSEAVSSRSVSVLGQDPSNRKNGGRKEAGNDRKRGKESGRENEKKEGRKEKKKPEESKKKAGGIRKENIGDKIYFKDSKDFLKTYLSPAVKVVILLSGNVEHLITIEMGLLLSYNMIMLVLKTSFRFEHMSTNSASGYLYSYSKASLHLQQPRVLHLPSLHHRYLHLQHHLQVPSLSLLGQLWVSYPFPVLNHSPSKNLKSPQDTSMTKLSGWIIFNSMYYYKPAHRCPYDFNVILYRRLKLMCLPPLFGV